MIFPDMNYYRQSRNWSISEKIEDLHLDDTTNYIIQVNPSPSFTDNGACKMYPSENIF